VLFVFFFILFFFFLISVFATLQHRGTHALVRREEAALSSPDHPHSLRVPQRFLTCGTGPGSRRRGRRTLQPRIPTLCGSSPTPQRRTQVAPHIYLPVYIAVDAQLPAGACVTGPLARCGAALDSNPHRRENGGVRILRRVGAEAGAHLRSETANRGRPERGALRSRICGRARWISASVAGGHQQVPLGREREGV